MNRTNRTLLYGVLALAALAAPAGAAAKAAPKPADKSPLFAVTLKGTQVSTWEHKHDPQGPCDAKIRGNGSQQIAYDLPKPIQLKLVVPKRGKPTLALPKDTLAQYGIPGFAIPFRVVADREGSQETIDAPGGACNGTGGWNGEKPARDCDERRFGRIDLHLGYAAWNGNPQPPPGRFQVTGDYLDFLEVPAGDLTVPQPNPTAPGEGKPLGHTFDDCPYWAKGPAGPDSDDLLPAHAKLPVGKLLRLAKGKTVKASGHKRTSYPQGDFKGDTLHTWNIKLKRIK